MVTVHHGGGPELNLVVHGVPVVYMCTVYQCTKDTLVVVQSGIWCTCGVHMYHVPVYQVHTVDLVHWYMVHVYRVALIVAAWQPG